MREILLTSSVLILAVLLLRRAFRDRISRRAQYVLWALVLVRLLVPVSLPGADFSVLSAAEPVGHWDAIAQQIARGLTEYFGLPFIYPMDPMQGTVSVSNGTLNLRDYPSSSGKVIANLPNGATVTIYGEWNGWYVVHYGDQVGYAAAAYINT